MNINLTGEIFVVAKKEQAAVNGSQTFYSLAVATDEGDAGNISCTKDVFDSVRTMSKYQASFVYRDGQYKGIRVIGLVKNLTSAPATK